MFYNCCSFPATFSPVALEIVLPMYRDLFKCLIPVVTYRLLPVNLRSSVFPYFTCLYTWKFLNVQIFSYTTISLFFGMPIKVGNTACNVPEVLLPHYMFFCLYRSITVSFRVKLCQLSSPIQIIFCSKSLARGLHQDFIGTTPSPFPQLSIITQNITCSRTRA